MKKIESVWRLRMLKSIFLLVGAFTLLLSLTSTQVQTLSNCRPYLRLHSSSRVEREDWRENVFTLEGQKFDIDGLVFTRDNRFLLTGSVDRTIVFWDMKTGQKTRTITLEPTITATH